MEYKKQLTCIVCPIGCGLEVTFHDEDIALVSGNKCKRGNVYAKEECTAPKRTLTTTMGVSGGALPLVSVKSEKSIPKYEIVACMKAIRTVQLNAPVTIGEILVKNVCGLGINIIATRNVPIKLIV